MLMQNDGNLVVYNSENQPQWASNSNKNSNGEYFTLDTDVVPDTLKAPFTKTFGLLLRSKNKKFILNLEQTGSLSIRKADNDKGLTTWDNN